VKTFLKKFSGKSFRDVKTFLKKFSGKTFTKKFSGKTFQEKVFRKNFSEKVFENFLCVTKTFPKTFSEKFLCSHKTFVDVTREACVACVGNRLITPLSIAPGVAIERGEERGLPEQIPNRISFEEIYFFKTCSIRYLFVLYCCFCCCDEVTST
jgi:hypothetical protein